MEGMESRLILQNRLKNFRTFRSVVLNKFILASNKNKNSINAVTSTDQGVGAVVPITVLMNLPPLLTLYFSSLNYWSLFGSIFCGAVLSYPFRTVQRRLHCQMDNAGMIPKRYSGRFS